MPEYETLGLNDDATLRRGYWDFSCGLQEVDGLHTSEYLDSCFGLSLRFCA